MTRAARGKRRQRGSIDTLPSGALRVRVYAGVDPVTKGRHDLIEIIPAGPKAADLAEKARTRLLAEVDERRNPRTSATVSQLLDKYLGNIDVGRTTLTRYRQVADLHIRPLIGKEKVGAVDVDMLDSLYAELRRCRIHCKKKRFTEHRTKRKHDCDERCGPHKCNPLAGDTVRKAHFLLSGAFGKAVRWKWVSVNPVDHAEPPAAARPNPQPPSAEEAAALLNRAWLDDPGWGALVWLSMTTGSRRGEVCALRWRHIDLVNAVVHMEKAIASDGSEIFEKDTKTHQDRRIALDSETVAVLTDQWERCVALAAALGIELSKDAFVFSPVPDGSEPPKPVTVSQRYRRLAERLGIDTSLKELRHYSATELISAGVDVRTVAGRLGHAGGGSTTLRVYAAWVSEADQRAAGKLLNRMPARPVPTSAANRVQRELCSPYEKLAVKLREQIVDGTFPAHTPLPSTKQLAADNGFAISTAHRAITLLKEWGLVEGSRGRRITVRTIERAASPPSAPVLAELELREDDERPGVEFAELEIRRDDVVVRRLTAEVDLLDHQQLKRLLINAVRRSGGDESELDRYEMDIRRFGHEPVLTTFIAAAG
ncbi:tyrosine-type recombinase/integrase [Crossiella sp. S99.2]|uniref:tyrosine-type recombinase/integrase n=1 Tax=Crossiella sp. S99.2 TaxID=2936272 RepID=UPI001FFEB953|nr:tyrosine-type recombinase/integrase [Crossiella sp. S99.2]MCK2238089.1 tyrosine-type recombinase/integrase [Crossiella sp. S99.2]